MEVEVVVKYVYQPCYTKPCEASIEVYLPVDEDGKLVKELQSPTYIFGSQLSEYPGQSVEDKDCRLVHTYVDEKTWEDLNDAIEETIAKLTADLHSIRNYNIQMMNTMPQERHVRIKIK